MLFTKPKTCQRGASVLEVAISIQFFLFFLLVSIDLGRAAYEMLTVQHVLNSTARWAILGQTLPSYDLTQSIEERAKLTAGALGVALSSSDFSVCPSNQFLAGACQIEDAGSPGDYIVLRVQKPFSVFFGSYQGTIERTAIARKEPV